jgi:hypothetical protein
MNASRWAKVVFWAAVAIAGAVRTADTAQLILDIGLTGARPPLSTADTALRIVLCAGALGWFYFRRDVLERVTTITGAAAAGSSMLYGFGLRSPALSAFRLVSHLILYALVVVVATRFVITGWRRRTSALE